MVQWKMQLRETISSFIMFENLIKKWSCWAKRFPLNNDRWKSSPLMTHLRNKNKMSKKHFDKKDHFLFVIFGGVTEEATTQWAHSLCVFLCRNCCTTTKQKWISFLESSRDRQLLYLYEVEYKHDKQECFLSGNVLCQEMWRLILNPLFPVF